MTQKLSGTEMAMNALFKMMGFDPNEVRKNVEEGIAGFRAAITDLQTRLGSIDENQRVINARLERIEISLGISAEVVNNDGPRIPLPKRAQE